MRKRQKVHMPAQVVCEIACFLVILRDYCWLVHRSAHQWDSRFRGTRKEVAVKVWRKDLIEPAKRFLQIGNDWAINEWVDDRTEWTQQLQSLFRHYFEPDQDILWEWGMALRRFLAEADRHPDPLGFRADEPEENWCRREEMFWDVELEVRALLGAANERLSHDLANPKPLTDLQKEVLKLIPQGTSEGITGKEIVSKLADMSLAQSTLTRHVIPVLKKYYGVCNDRAVGYFRLLEPRNARIGAAYIR